MRRDNRQWQPPTVTRRNRLRWKLADELRRQVDVECAALETQDALEILDLNRTDIPILNAVRAELIGGLRHD